VCVTNSHFQGKLTTVAKSGMSCAARKHPPQQLTALVIDSFELKPYSLVLERSVRAAKNIDDTR
jgi:hypothetical protein